MKLTKKFFCPVNAWECPYWSKGDICHIDNPIIDCEDALLFYEDEESPFVWEDENGNLYDEQQLLEMGYHFVNGAPVMPPMN